MRERGCKEKIRRETGGEREVEKDGLKAVSAISYGGGFARVVA